MSATDLQALLRFLSQDAKIPLAIAMSKVKELQNADLDSPDKLSKAKPDNIEPVFADEKVCKQVISAAKRVSKKRAAGDESSASPSKKKRKDVQLFTENEIDSPAKLESSVALPTSHLADTELAKTVVFSNRAPLVLAFVVTLLKHTMPEQPLSSRLSLAQAYVSITSRSRAVSLGMESGKGADEEGFGEGQPIVTIMGKDIRVLKRWGYEWKSELKVEHQDEPSIIKVEAEDQTITAAEEQPALWGLDLEAVKKSEVGGRQPPRASSMGSHNNMPIYTPQSARNYLLKAFDAPPRKDPNPSKKPSTAVKEAEKEQNLGQVLRALDLLYESWADTITPQDLDKRTWSWYVKVRPDVENGVAGWGGKNHVKISDILDLRRKASEDLRKYFKA